jgi:hypothetical protein
MQQDTWSRVGVDRLHFHFNGKPGTNVDLEAQNNPWEYFELFITPEIAKLISRETNQYSEQFLGNKSDMKLKSRVQNWNDANRDEVMKLKMAVFWVVVPCRLV